MEQLRNDVLELTSFVLAQASIWWGLMVSIGYEFAFAMVVSRDRFDPAGSTGGLPMLLPVIGIIFGALAALAARWNGQRNWYATFGLALNAVPMALALVIWILHRAG